MQNTMQPDTLRQVIEHLIRLPDEQLSEVYAFLLELEEQLADNSDLAVIEARQDEPTRSVEDFFAELDAHDAAANNL